MRRMLAVLGDYYHCSDQLVAAVRSLDLPGELDVTIARYPDPFDPRDLAGYDVLVLARMGRLRPRESEETWLDEQTQEALSAHIRSGNGLVLVHSGTASHPIGGAFRRLAGGHFLHHPPQHPPVTVTVTTDHPITRGVGEFTHPDEHYFMEVDEGVTALATARSELGEQCAGWCREHGAGRVAAIVPGHTREMLEEPALRLMIANAIGWVARL